MKPPSHSAAIQVTFDCTDPHVLAPFWAEVLGYNVVNNPDLIQSLLDQGMVTEDDVTRIDGVLFFAEASACEDAQPPAGAGPRPRLLFQAVPEPRASKNRVHLDVHLDRETSAKDRLAEEARIIGLGATRIGDGAQGQHTWVILADPEGNEFCLG